MYFVQHLSPMIPSSNVPETLAFFTTVLKFNVTADFGRYAIVQKENQMLHIKHWSGEIEAAEFYLEVDDVDSFWDSIKDHLSGLQSRPPFDQEYGMREAHIAVPATKTVIYAGHAIAR